MPISLITVSSMLSIFIGALLLAYGLSMSSRKQKAFEGAVDGEGPLDSSMSGGEVINLDFLNEPGKVDDVLAGAQDGLTGESSAPRSAGAGVFSRMLSKASGAFRPLFSRRREGKEETDFEKPVPAGTPLEPKIAKND